LGKADSVVVRVAERGMAAPRILAQWLGEISVMSIRSPAALAGEARSTAVETRSVRWAWIETALTVMLTTVAVLVVSLFAVVTNL